MFCAVLANRCGDGRAHRSRARADDPEDGAGVLGSGARRDLWSRRVGKTFLIRQLFVERICFELVGATARLLASNWETSRAHEQRRGARASSLHHQTIGNKRSGSLPGMDPLGESHAAPRAFLDLIARERAGRTLYEAAADRRRMKALAPLLFDTYLRAFA